MKKILPQQSMKAVRRKVMVSLLLVSASALLSACQATGENIQGNVYKAGQVNTAQEAKIIKILAVLPAQIEVDNAEQKKRAQVIGGVLGAVGGGILGNKLSDHSADGTALGAVGGGAAGVGAGSLVDDKVLVPGVSIAYEMGGKTLTSAQVGKLCEYVPGKALLVSTAPNETRVQPNATCPAEQADKN